MLSSCGKPDPLPYYTSADFTPIWNPSMLQLKRLHKTLPFSFNNQYEEVITEKDMAHKLTIVNFFFTQCFGQCPRITKNIQTVHDLYKDNENLIFLSYSVMPDLDTTVELSKFADRYNIQKGNWHFLRGDKKEIFSLASNSYFVGDLLKKPIKDRGFMHTELVLLIDENRHIRGIYNGSLRLEMNRLMDDLEKVPGRSIRSEI
jgi:protein SCO1